MKIRVSGGHRSSRRNLIARVEEALRERASLGLAPAGEFSVVITYYTKPGRLASTYNFEGEPVIMINALQHALIYGNFQNEDQRHLRFLLQYLRVAYNYFKDTGDFLSFVEEPGRLSVERAGKGYEGLHLPFLGEEARGYREYLLKNLDAFRETLGLFREKSFDTIAEGSLNFIRHEIDHVAFFSSEIYRKYIRVFQERERERACSLEGGRIREPDLCLLKSHQYLTLLSWFVPLSEIEAGFFNFVSPFGWREADYEKVKELVLQWFWKNYMIKVLPVEIAEALLISKWAAGEVDLPTAAYIKKAIETQESTSQLALDAEAKRVLEVLDWWKRRFWEVAVRVCEAAGEAYRKNPRLFTEAYRASDLEGFISILRAADKAP